MTHRANLLASLILLCAVSGVTAPAAGAARIQPLSPNLYVLTDSGRNTTICIDRDLVYLIDNTLALTPEVKSAIETLSPKPVRPLLNTRPRPPKAAGQISEEAAEPYRRMRSGERQSLNICGYEMTATGVGAANAADDVVIHIGKANVYLMGDLYFSQGYPYIDLYSGGDINGVVKITERYVGEMDAESKVVPAFGPVADRKALKAYHEMVRAVRDRVGKAIADGKTLVDLDVLRPTADFDGAWGNGDIKGPMFAQLVYASLKGAK